MHYLQLFEFDSNLKIAEDFKFCLECFRYSTNIKFVGCCYYNYFRNDTSAMHSVSFEKICNTLDACKYGISLGNDIKDKEIKKLCSNMVSENLLSVFARVNDYSEEENKYLIEELSKLKKNICYGSSAVKEILIILIKIVGIKKASRFMNIVKKK